MKTERFEDRLLHALKEHVAQNAHRAGTAEVVRTRSAGGRWARRVPLTLAAGAAAAALAGTLGLGQSAPSAPGSSTRVTNAAYTLEKDKATGRVRLVIVDPSGEIDVETMQRNLAAMGVRARVLLGEPDCANPSRSKPGAKLPFHLGGPQDGEPTLVVAPSLIPAGHTLVIGLAVRRHSLEKIAAGMTRGDGSDCVPAPAATGS
ncbi:hypothetical protein E6R18_24675 [Streptomyces sp. A1277]|uniref:hypothetical protein n=1 Tax=Streptomyces sp. A1277 TaxID=2563103 RepID=UPI0010A25F25|nr:hypothetical protein [Streptomyces sp. A1277]THA29292.1 hypothetical protein E6R18_24675 [Streptomyces sp. A1277]